MNYPFTAKTMGNIEINLTGDGIKPIFTSAEMTMLKKKALTGDYWLRAFRFVRAYKTMELPWEIMWRVQREWLWKIKDDLK